jgi:hypothetical protein
MNLMCNSAIAVLILTMSVAYASDFPKVDADLKAYDDNIIEMKNEFGKVKPDENNKEWVKLKLSFMVQIDQYMRSMWQSPSKNNYTAEETAYFRREFLPRNDKLDSDNTQDLKRLLKVYTWFTISNFGSEADSQAWLIVQHADLDPEFQKEVLSVLTDLWPKNETSAKNYAYLFDRVAASWSEPSKRRLQRYGTQGQCVGPKLWEPIPIEEPDFVDQRRASVGLNTMAEYKLVVKNLCP